MLRNYFITAWRNIWKNSFYSGLNILGLAIGMAACIVIMLFVFYEQSFDGQHTKAIYRLNEVQKFEGMVAPQKVALSMYPMASALKAEFAEVKNFTRIRENGNMQLGIGEKKIVAPIVKYVDSTFLQMFDFKLLEGNRNIVLQKPNSILLTKETAFKLFGNQTAVGKTISRYSNDTTQLTVTGILENIPGNSHLQFDALISFSTIYRPHMMENWGGNWLVTYLELAPNTNVAAMEKKFPAFLKRHMAQDENWKNYELFLQPLKEVHGGSTSITHDYQNHQKFDVTYTYIFSVIALIVLVIACINFMNLSTARSAGRAREVGIRKSIGAARLQLAGQFIGESVLVCLIAMLLGVGLVQLLLPFVVELSQRPLRLPLFTDPWLLLVIPGGAVFIGVLAGLYPAAYLSSFKPVKVLKGSIQVGKNKGMLRNILVVGQFTGAICLIIATVFVLQQLRFMQKKDPGFTREQIVLIPLNFASNPKYHSIKQELQGSTLIAGVTGSGQRLGNNLHQNGMVFRGNGPERRVTSSLVIVDPDFLTLYNIRMIAGRNFSNDYSDNGKSYIINESMARELLKDHPKAPISSLLGKQYGFMGMDSLGQIVGITADFNFNSLHHKVETLTLYNQRNWGFNEISVRIDGSRAKEALAFIEATWKKQVPGHAFEYSFLDEHFEQLYKADAQVSKIVSALATLAIIIACLGLFGLAAYASEKRVKEIGIRKVLGASVQNIVGLLSRDFVKLVLIANLIAWPLAWFALNRWLQDFAYRIDITWWVFVAAGLAALLIALFTVSFQAIKAAVTNPVQSLRTE